MGRDAAGAEFPFKETAATEMLKAALQNAQDERGLSTRAVARKLGYKASVVISHMQTGRVPIPLDRAADIAEVVGIDPREFLLAVLEQRHPGSLKVLGANESTTASPQHFVAELEVLAASRLDDLPEEHKRVLREVVTDKAPARRWLTIAELSTMLLLRRVRPDFATHGIPQDDLSGIEAFLKHTA